MGFLCLVFYAVINFLPKFPNYNKRILMTGPDWSRCRPQACRQFKINNLGFPCWGCSISSKRARGYCLVLRLTKYAPFFLFSIKKTGPVRVRCGEYRVLTVDFTRAAIYTNQRAVPFPGSDWNAHARLAANQHLPLPPLADPATANAPRIDAICLTHNYTPSISIVTTTIVC